MVNPNKNCINCALRHNICGYDYTTENCEHFEIGKCFICSNKNNKELCQAEDMSGYGCNNFIDSENVERAEGYQLEEFNDAIEELERTVK